VRILWSPEALTDLAKVYSYIANDSPESAEKSVRTIVRASETLGEFPTMGRIGAVPGTRERLLSRYPYKVVYRKQGSQIEIIRVLHMSQDWS
jgi:toxin ParE1/3/4